MLRLIPLFVFVLLPEQVQTCTTVAIGKKATADGSTIATYNADSSQLDFRIAYIPPKDHAPGEMRPVYSSDGNYPRYVGVRSKTYDAKLADGVMQKTSVPIGHIPEVSHTYGYWEACYGFMNEKGLGFGESTTMGKIGAASLAAGGTALFSVDALMQLALERCDSARCAIETMGYWATSKGFYGEDTAPSDSGEVLTVVDGDEAWVFHIMADFHGGAVWAAQRVPDDHAAVAANNFIIRHINFDDHKHTNFMWSEDILTTSQELVSKGSSPEACSAENTFDFLICFGGDIRVEAYNPGYGLPQPDPWYTTLRMWRVRNLLAPSHGHEPTDNAFDLPFSFPVDKPVSVLDAMNIQRDQLQGTPYDLSKGAMAGPHGDPNRDEGGDSLLQVPGYYPRAISLIRTSYSLVCHSKQDSPDIAWVATHQPATAVYVPVFAESDDSHESYARGSQFEFDRHSAWWTFSFVSNWMRLDWKSMFETFVSPKLHQLQGELVEAATHITQDFTSHQKAMQGRIIEEWTRLGDFLVMSYNNGYSNYPQMATRHGYPEAWLKAIGFHATLRPLLVQPFSTVENLAGSLPSADSSTFFSAACGFVAGGFLVASLSIFRARTQDRLEVKDGNYCRLSGA